MMLDPATMQMLMSIMGMGGAQAQTMESPMGPGMPESDTQPFDAPGALSDFLQRAQQPPPGFQPVPGMPSYGAPPTSPAPAASPPPGPVPLPIPKPGAPPMAQGPMQGPGFEQMGRMGARGGPQVPGQVPGPGPAGAPTGGGMMNPQMMAALQAIQQPESENRGPPQPPASPGGPRAIDPGLLFEALLKMGVHPGQIPSLTKSLGG